MNKIGNKISKIIAGILFSFVAIFFLIGTGLSIPGQGLQSLKFINSVSKEVDKVFPKGKYVLNNKELLFGQAKQTLKSAFEGDVLSTLNSKDIEADLKKPLSFASTLKKFADDWFNQHFAKNFDEKVKQNIDLNDVGHSVIDMDKEVASKFHSASFVSTGIQFFYNNKSSVKKLFSSNLKLESKTQEKIMKQNDYDQGMDYEIVAITNVLSIKKSIGTNIVNNKAWFLNTQIETVNSILNGLDQKNPLPWGPPYIHIPTTLFVNQDKIGSNMNVSKITEQNYYHPNFTKPLNVLKSGVVMTLMSPFMAVVAIPLGVVILIFNKKQHNDENENPDE